MGHLDHLVIPDKNVLRENASMMMSALIKKFVKTIIASIHAKLELAKRITFAKLFVMSPLVEKNSSQNPKSQGTFSSSENPTNLAARNNHKQEVHRCLQTHLLLEADMKVSAERDKFLSHSSFNSRLALKA